MDKVLYKDAQTGLVITQMEDLPRDCNPLRHDAMRMMSHLVRGWVAMHDGYDSPSEPRPLGQLILINTRTGKRLRLDLPKDW